MATLVDSAETPAPFGGLSSLRNTSPTASAHHFDEGKYYLLVVIGELVTDQHLKCAIADIEKGIRTWDTNLIDCNLDEELKLFVSRHSARFSADVRGQKILHHKSNVLETVVLINPSDEAVSTEVRLMVSDTAHHKLVVLAGQCFENTGELILQSGSFSLSSFIDIFTDQEIGELLSTINPANKASLTLFCPEHGDWKNSNLDKHNLQDFIYMKLNAPTILPEMEGLSEFTEYLSESVEIPSPFDMLEPPTSGGFLKLSKPCCYIFPGGRGDSALFAVNGFNMLINGGSDRKSCFWKLVRHLDRVDSVLLTHIGDDNLPGINSMLLRKISELEEEQSQGSTANSEWTKNMISPDIGVMFANMPQNMENLDPNYRIRRNAEEASLTMQYLSKLSLKPEPLHRNVGNTVEPLILFQKMGVGKLEMYVLNPSKNSKELQYFLKEWTGSDKDKASILLPNGEESELPVSYLSSISSLIVWHPANPSEKIIRVLFPGNATQNNILEGLDKLKHLDFLKYPVLTEKELNANLAPVLKQAKMKHKTDSKESLKSTSKPSPSKKIHRESKDESAEKLKSLKTDTAEAHETTQKIEKKEKVLVKKVKAVDKDIKSKIEQTPKTETPEKKKADIKPRAVKKEVKKPLDDKKVEKPSLKKEEKTKKEEKMKKEEAKKEGSRREIRKDSLLRDSRKEEKKEMLKDTKEPMKDLRKTGSLKRSSTSTPEVKKSAPKPKVAPRGKSPGSPAKTKLKSKSKLGKKDTTESVAPLPVSGANATADDLTVEPGATDVLDTERSLMSSPEDLTKDFEALKTEEIAGDNEIVSQTKTDESHQEDVIRHEEITQCKESPEAAESLDEGIATTEAEEECGGTPGDHESNQKSNGASEKFEDEGTGLEESSELGDYEEKGDIEEVEEQDRDTSLFKDDGELGKVPDEDNKKILCKHDEGAKVQGFEVMLPQKLSAPECPAVSIQDETLPRVLEKEIASDDENQDEPPEDYTTSGHTQSTIEISSVPTPIDDMSTPRDLMSDEATNDESDSPSQDCMRYGMMTEYERTKLSPLQDLPELDHSKSDATEGHDYDASASTISPPSSLEEDKSARDVILKDKFSFDSNMPTALTDLPFVRSPSCDKNVNIDHVHQGVSSPIELGTTLAGLSKGMESNSPDEKTAEGPLSPQSTGHTPYYQSPIEEKENTLSSEKTSDLQGPIIVDITSDKEYSPREASPIDEAVPGSRMANKQFTNSLTNYELDNKISDQTEKYDEKSATDGGSSTALIFPTKEESLSETKPPITFKEENKMSISEDEVVADDTFSHVASASTASLATSSLPEPTTDDVSPSLHAEVGSPHSTEVDDSFSVSIVQTPTMMQETEVSPSKEDSPRPMSISPDTSPKTAKLKMPQQESKSTERSLSALSEQESPEHSFAMDFSKQSPDHPSVGGMLSASAENGPTEVEYGPSDGSSLTGEHRPDNVRDNLNEPGSSQMDLSNQSVSNMGNFEESVLLKHSPRMSPSSPNSFLDLQHPSTSHDEKDKPSPTSLNKDCCTEKLEKRAEKPGSPLSPKTERPKLDNIVDSELPTSPKMSAPAPISPSSNQTGKEENFSCSSTLYSYSCEYKEPGQFSNEGSRGPDTTKTSQSKSRSDVDLCLVTSCEYRHPKTELSPSFINPSPLEYFMNEEQPLEEERPLAKSGGEQPPFEGKNQSKQHEETPPTSVSESAPSQTDSDVPPGTEECPSITADANIDSEDDSETLPTDRTITYRHADPPPVMPRDPAPAPAHPDACMVDPEALKAEEAPGKQKKNTSSKTKPSAAKGLSKTSAIKESKVSSPKKTTDDKDAKNATNTSASRGVKHSSAGIAKSSNGTPLYMDLVYIPNHCNAKNVDAEFFKRIRSSYYVVSGNDPTAQEPSKAVLDALLEGKSQWENNMQVTLIPTHDTEVMREWYQETHEKQQDLNIMVLASSSTVVMQDESFPACKIEL
ncbi:hypothetical protein DNTS_013742 [Danionella cerebrum]|uniref:Microtubule-associated protein 1B n=1 Tax=Danionella cerebrum TaxID=2873325 RepID=A0A553R227_9TELE|nr:hypothetical protein DNTS_013742 [Danionella translucida]